MAVTEATEIQAAAFRAKHRQDKVVPWLIRDDGMIYPNVPLLAKLKTMRPYTGDIKAPLEERLKYLSGLPTRRAVTFDEPEPFNISTASKQELIAFAMDEYSEPIGEDEHLNKVRATVCSLCGLDYNVVFGGGKATAGGLQPAQV